MDQKETSRKLSIILPVKNAYKETVQCIQSIYKWTSNFELIIIDDGSSEDLKEYLRYIYETDETGQTIKVIRHDNSKGFCSSINEGLVIAQGQYIVISNSDVIYHPLWAEKMYKYFEDYKTLGILSPISNNAYGKQVVEYAYPKDEIPPMDFESADYLMFFCVMMRKEVYEQVGPLDTRFDPGGQEDADYCIRARKAGWVIGIAKDVFIYHHGSASFKEEFNNDIEKSKEYAESRQKLLQEKYAKKVIRAKDLMPSDFSQKRLKKRIFIAIPSDGFIANTLAMFLLRLLYRSVLTNQYDLQFSIPEGLFPLDNARNTLVKDFLEQDYDYIWWIDRDITPPDNALDKLIAADKDIIGAVAISMRQENGMSIPYPVTLRYDEEGSLKPYYGQDIDWVDATGGACILYKRHVFEQIERPYEFKYHRDGTLALTCDFHIFQKLRGKGIKPWIDFSIICEHKRTANLKEIQNLLAHLKEQNASIRT